MVKKEPAIIPAPDITSLYKNVKQVIEKARETVYRSANITMLGVSFHDTFSI